MGQVVKVCDALRAVPAAPRGAPARVGFRRSPAPARPAAGERP
jgi:hypothetical protein